MSKLLASALAISALAASMACGGGGGAAPNPTLTVAYSGNGNTGGVVPVDPNRYQPGETVTVLGNTGSLTKTGCRFAGWSTEASGSGTTYAQGQTFAMGSSNVTLYAEWTANPAYTVTYDGNGDTGGSVPVDANGYQQGQTITVLGNTGNLARAGYGFAGWNTDANGSGTTYTQGQTFAMGSSNATLYAEWTANPTYAVTYHGNNNTGGSVPVDSNRYQQGQTVTVLGNTGNLTRTSYTFAGWNTRADATGTEYTLGQAFTMGSAPVVLYAVWSPNPTYTVTYTGNGNSSGIVPIDTTHYEQGRTVTVLGNTGNLKRTGYAFVGWNSQANGMGTTYQQGQTFTMGSTNVTLYAKWANAYTVTYLGNHNTGGAVPVDSNAYLPGQTATVLSNVGNLAHSPFSFVHWNTQADGTGTTLAPGSTILMGAANVLLYAQWDCVTYYPSSNVTVLNDCGLEFWAPASPSVTTPAGDCELILNPLTGYFETARVSPWNITWIAETAVTCSICFWSFQSDGNLVFYDTGHRAIWASNTNGNPGSELWVTPALSGCGVVIRNASGSFIFQAP